MINAAVNRGIVEQALPPVRKSVALLASPLPAGISSAAPDFQAQR